VTYLTTFYNHRSWAYVETRVNGQTARGFIPSEAIDWGNAVDEDPGKQLKAK
jgi:hypothetical protein